MNSTHTHTHTQRQPNIINRLFCCYFNSLKDIKSAPYNVINKLKCVITAEAKTGHYFLVDRHSLLSQRFLQLFEELVGQCQ
jgi:hypothetical protein